MSPDDELERRVRANESQVVRLDERIDYATKDRDLIRREVATGDAAILKRMEESDQRVVAEIREVDEECRQFREEVRAAWEQARREQQQRDEQDRREKQARKEREQAAREQEKGRATQRAVAWIGGVLLLLGTIAQSVAAIVGSG